MKKIFSSVLAIAVSVSCVIANCSLTGYAYELTTETGECVIPYEFTLSDADSLSLGEADMPALLSSEQTEYNYGDFLDENNRAVYDALSVWSTPSEEIIEVTLPETISVEVTGLPGSDEYTEEDALAYQEAVFSNCKPGIDSILFDMPEIFWLNPGELIISIGSASYSQNIFTGVYTLKLKSFKFQPVMYEVYDSIDTAMEYKEKIETAVETYNVEGETRYEQLKSMHDSIALFTYYDVEAVHSSTVVGALLEPGVVCEGYSKGLKILCDYYGIPCVLVYGNYDPESNVAHMWNYVQMEDGKWYAIDMTWDDLDGTDGAEIKYQYFLKGSASFNTNHTPESDYEITLLEYPELSVEDYTPASSGTTSDTTTTTTTTSTTTTTTSTTTTTTSTTTSTTTTTTASTTTSTTTTTTSTTSTTTTTEPVYMSGDFNKDGVVNVADLVICANEIIGRSNEYFCDFNEDGYEDLFDLILMRKFIANE